MKINRLTSPRESGVEPSYNDRNHWMRWYAEQHELQRARQESDNLSVDQAGFEQQLSKLQLRACEESSAELSSPDTRAAEGHGSIQRTVDGGSIRTPSRSNLQDNGFSRTRHSVDLPRAHLRGSAVEGSRSDLRERLFNSTRYTAPSEPEVVARTRDKRSGGLWSRVKSGLGKAFGGSRREKFSGGSGPDAMSSELRMDFVKRGRSAGEDMHPEDERCIGQFAEAVRGYEILPDGSLGRGDGRVPEPTLTDNQGVLTAFARWLRAQNRDPMASRLFNDPESLAADIEDYRASGGDHRERLKSALSHLRRLSPDGQELHAVGPGPRLMGRFKNHPYPDDTRIIDAVVNEALSNAGPDPTPEQKSRVSTMATKQRRFSDWLQREARGSIVSRISGTEQQQLSLRADQTDFYKATRQTVSLDQIRKYRGLGPGVQKLNPYADDARIIDAVVKEELSKLESDLPAQRRRAVDTASGRRRFSDWLKAGDRGSIVSRLIGSDQQRQSLKLDVKDFAKTEGKPVLRLDQLRQYLGAESASKSAPFDPYPDDARLIEGLAHQELTKLGMDSTRQRDNALKIASKQRKFSDWLRQGGRESIVSRVNGSDVQKWSLKVDYRDFVEAVGQCSVSLDRLGQYLQVVEANAALGLSPEQTGGEPPPAGTSSIWSPRLRSDFEASEWPTREGSSGQAGRQESAGSSSAWSPRVPSDFDASMWPSPEGPSARSSEIYGGLDSLVDLPSTAHETPDDAYYPPEPNRAARSPFMMGPSRASELLEDIGYLVGEDWQHGSQPVSDLLIDVLDNKMLMPSSHSVPKSVSINGETYSIELGQGRRDAYFVHHPRQSSASDAHIRASVGSLVLGPRQWLRDQHILMDYRLLEQELQRDNPNLAARTRLVDPLIAFQLGHAVDSDALAAFHRIVVDRNGNDSADFLFLPVNDASATDLNRRGTHWSLLLVDRRDREGPVAYHYDSSGGHNDQPAAWLAARLGANLQDASMRQQRNDYDCGVFVVDGTRTLVGRLAGTRQADLRNLDNLVVDRQALLTRISHEV